MIDEAVRAIVRDEMERWEAGRTGWLTAQEAADYVGISLGSLYNAVNSKRLPRNGAPGEKLVFSKQQLDEYVAGRRS